MRFLLRTTAAGLVLAAALAGLSSGAGGHYAVAAVVSGNPGFLSVSSAAPFLAPSAPPPPAALGAGSSVFPPTTATCSIFGSGPATTCSVLPGAAAECSALCDNDQICSAISTAAAPAHRSCSVADVNNGVCSVLPGGAPPVPGLAFCSAGTLNAGTITVCSAIGSTGSGKRCSARNASPTADPRNFCSAQPIGTPDQASYCSVMSGSSATRNFCSVEQAGPKRCSTFGTSFCSVIRTQSLGKCSSFRGANGCSAFNGPPNTCSVVVRAGFISGPDASGKCAP